jgi:hypothetical protein
VRASQRFVEDVFSAIGTRNGRLLFVDRSVVSVFFAFVRRVVFDEFFVLKLIVVFIATRHM